MKPHLDNMTTQGAYIIAIGEKAHQSAARCVASLEKHCPDLPVTMISDIIMAPANGVRLIPLPSTYEYLEPTPAQRARYWKTMLPTLSRHEHFMYLDADTQVRNPDVMVGFDLLADGFDLVITPSTNQDGDDWLWHCDYKDRSLLLTDVGYKPLALQGGVWWAARDRIGRLFTCWHDEWVFGGEGQDQAALLRALHRCPVRVALLGRPFNGGAVVAHDFGRARA